MKFKQESANAGSWLNIKRTNNLWKLPKFNVANEEIENVEDFLYLGSIILIEIATKKAED